MYLKPRWSAIKRFALAGLAVTLQAEAAIVGPVTAEDSIGLIRTAPGTRVELAAAEPDVFDPVALAFDEHGRLYVIENRGYPIGPGEGKPPAGTVAVLEDPDGDGRYQRRATFAEGLAFPNGVLPWKGGILVTCAPDVLYLADTDGDSRADIREVLLTGFSEGGSTQLQVSHPLFGPDGWIYFTNGLSGGKVFCPKKEASEPVDIGANDCRFHPETLAVEPVSGQAQFGQTFDRYGRRFVCSNRRPIDHCVFPLAHLSLNPHFAFTERVQNLYGGNDPVRLFPISENITTAVSHAGTFTAACGLCVYGGTALPRDFQDHAFVCDPTGNLIHCAELVPDGVSFRARRHAEGMEFAASTDNWFRPVFCANGPDGALYVCDMYRKTIEHPVYLPEAIRKITDFESGKDRGRIYRFIFSAPRPPDPRASDSGFPAERADLCALLDHSDSWRRETAQRLLLERPMTEDVPTLAEFARSGKTGPGRVLALRSLEALHALSKETLLAGLADSEPGVRENALELSAEKARGSALLRERILRMSGDPDPRVRYRCALAMGLFEQDGKAEALAEIALAGLPERWTRAAVLSSTDDGARLLHLLAEKRVFEASGAGELLRPLARMIARQEPADTAKRVVGALLAPPGEIGGSHLALTVGVCEGLPEGSEGLPQQEAFGRVFAQAKERAVREGEPLSARTVSIELLGYTLADFAEEILRKLIDPREPREVQTSAIRALGRLTDSHVGGFLVEKERWEGFTPTVRSTALSTLLSRAEHIPALLDALEGGQVAIWTIDPNSRLQLLRHSDPAIRERAGRVFEAVETGDRRKVFEDYLSVLSLSRDREHGQEVFKTHCAQCHLIEGEGKEVGPDLTGVRTQPDEALLLHILVPNHEIVPGFTNYLVETVEGDLLSGLIAAETPTSLTLRQAGGEEQTVLRSEISSIRSTSLSLMPQEMERTMTRKDLADLIGFLKGN
ncbi:MAG: hypothetical protein GHCLOJNM_02296 [bacterium]|nr:hypothetical protein [bacterium]